jgi:hypothetical protein
LPIPHGGQLASNAVHGELGREESAPLGHVKGPSKTLLLHRNKRLLDIIALNYKTPSRPERRFCISRIVENYSKTIVI